MELQINHVKLREALEGREIKQCMVARAAGLTPSTVSAVLGGWLPVGQRVWGRLKSALVSLGIPPGEVGKLLDE